MIILPILALMIVGAQAGHISMTFRGLDANYTFTTNAISTLREIIACRAGLNHSMVLLDSITIKNMTLEFDVNDEVNGPVRLIPYNCYFLNSAHWDMNPSRINRSLLKELKDDIEVTFKLQFPGNSEKAYGANIIPFLATSVNEYYAEILENNYMAFYAGSIPELIRDHQHLGIFKEYDQLILFYMFIVQIALVFIGNIILNKLKKTVPPPRGNWSPIRGTSEPICIIIK